MHLLLWVSFGAMAGGSAAIGITLFVYAQRRKRVVLLFSAFLGSLSFFLASLSVRWSSLSLPSGPYQSWF